MWGFFCLFFGIDAYTCLFFSLIDLVKIPPGFRVGMDFSSKGTSCFLTQKQQSKNAKQFNINFVFFLLHPQDAKIAKPEVNLMSLLSSFDDVSLLQPEEDETELNKDRGEAPKLPKTNSLEDLGIKVRVCFYLPHSGHSEHNAHRTLLLFWSTSSITSVCLIAVLLCAQDAAPSSSPKEAATKGKDEQPKENVKEEKKWAVPVNITSPCSDFYKRVPNPAFKVGLPLLLKHPTSGVCVHFFSTFFSAAHNISHVSFFLCLSQYNSWVIVRKSRPVAANLISLPSACSCSSGLLSWTCSRSRPSWGWRLTTRCLWRRTRQPGRRWWPSTPSRSPRNIWPGVCCLTSTVIGFIII